MYRKKFAAFLAAGIFLFNSATFAQAEENSVTVDEPFEDVTGKKSHSSTINHTDERDKKENSKEVEEENLNQNKAPIPVDEPFQEPKSETPATAEEGNGLEFLMYNENGVQAFAVIAAHEQYNLRPIVAQHHIKGRSTVSQMARELNDIATINAGYFSADGSLIGVTKINGKIISSDYFTRSAIGINSDDTTIFGRVHYSGKITFHGTTVEINGINCPRDANRLIVYNDFFSNATGTNNFGVEIIEHNGIIIDIARNKGNNLIPKGGHVISAHGTAAELFADAQIGEEIIFSESIDSEDADFNSATYILGAGPCLIRNGRIFVTSADEKFPSDIAVGRAPRSAVGVTKYGDYILAVVDGRQAHSRGCTLEEWADILLNKFGAYNAINLDGGGSTELTVKDNLVNSPSDGSERPVGSALTILPK